MKGKFYFYVYILISIQLFSNILLFAENQQYSKLSPNSALLLTEINKDKIQFFKNHSKGKSYRLSKINNQLYVSGLIKVNPSLNDQILKQKGVLIGTKAGNIWTAKIPVSIFEEICDLKEIEYIQIDEPLKTKLDEAIKITNVDDVHLGTQLNLHPYKGKGVIIGMLDIGFDYTNPNFLDESGTKTRIIKVWDMNLTSGTPPKGFDYGTEIDPKDFQQYMTDTEYESHGTHTSGIAGGSGYGLSKYKGMAPEAEFIFVAVGGSGEMDDQSMFASGQSAAVDAINYIFGYAQSFGKPAVVNMSLGTHIGPHDGSSLFDQACDNLVGPGKILVGSAGNEADVTVHLAYQFNKKDDTFSTLLMDGGEWGGADIWGENGTDFCIKLVLYDLENKKELDNSDWFCTKDLIIKTDMILSYNQDTCIFFVATKDKEYNNKSRISFSFDNPTEFYVMLKVKGTNGKINMWNINDLEFFSKGINGLIDGDNKCSIGEIGGTGKSIISVGAYSTRNKFTNLNNNEITSDEIIGNFVSFSSLGPAVDGRMKPDITAPGSQIISSTNHLDKGMIPDGYMFYNAVARNIINKQSYYFAAFEGTSMSCPMVTGIVALMLEKNKKLTPDIIKNAISKTSIHDSFTGYQPNNTWGYGKIDALALMKFISPTDVDENKDTEKLVIYPNPAKNELFINLSDNQDDFLNLEIIDYLGNIVFNKQITNSENRFVENIDITNINNGCYVIKIISRKKSFFSKIFINR